MPPHSTLYLAEFIGTALLVTLGLSVVAAISLRSSAFYGAGGGVAALGWGAAMTSAAIIVAPISGAHCNPAFTLGFFLAGRFPAEQIPGYILAQAGGAFCGALLVWVLYREHLDSEENPRSKLGVFATAPAIRGGLKNTLAEATATFILMLTVLSFPHSLPANGVAFLYLFIALSGGVMAFAGLTGYAINPARDLMPRLIHTLLPIRGKGSSDWRYAWVPIVGPLLGAALAALCYRALFSGVGS
ncbi:MIP/aquaporin family protein [Edwardsiella piscicida]|uniref:MIP/aquaporin family protein n=1 Tax=Edwardsiella piscicida TaxID=1263550 RepID=UPI00370D9E19